MKKRIFPLIVLLAIAAIFVVGCTDTSAPTAITIKTKPKIQYFVDQPLDLTGGVITVVLNNGEKVDINMTDTNVSVTGFDSNSSGKKTLTVTYMEKTAEFDVDVFDVAPQSLVVKTNPNLNYYQNDELDLSGGILSLVYNNLQTQDVDMTDADVTVAGYDKTVLGGQTVTLTYEGLTTTINVNVYEVLVRSIQIKSLPKTTQYFPTEQLDLTDGEIFLNYNNGDQSSLSMLDQSVVASGFDSTTSGEKNITLEYDNFVTAFSVNVLTIQSIKMGDLPSNLVYDDTASFVDLSGGTLIIVADDGNSGTIEKTIDLTHPVISLGSYNFNTVGPVTITVNFLTFSTEFSITVQDSSINDITSTDAAPVYYALNDAYNTYLTLINSTGNIDSDLTFFVLDYLKAKKVISDFLNSSSENKLLYYNQKIKLSGLSEGSTMEEIAEFLDEMYALFIGDLSTDLETFYDSYLELARLYVDDPQNFDKIANFETRVQALYDGLKSLSSSDKIYFYTLINIYYQPNYFVGYSENIFNFILECYFFSLFDSEDEEITYFYIRYAEEAYALYEVDISYAILFQNVMAICIREYETIVDPTVFDSLFGTEYQSYVSFLSAIPDISNPSAENIAILNDLNAFVDVVFEKYDDIWSAFYAYYIFGSPMPKLDTTEYMIYYLKLQDRINEEIFNSGDDELILLYYHYRYYDEESVSYWYDYLTDADFGYAWFLSEFLGNEEDLVDYYNYYLQVAYNYHFDDSYRAGATAFDADVSVLLEKLYELSPDYQIGFYITVNIGYEGKAFWGMNTMFNTMIHEYYFNVFNNDIEQITLYFNLLDAVEKYSLSICFKESAAASVYYNNYIGAMQTLISSYEGATNTTPFDACFGTIYTTYVNIYTELTA